MPHAPTGHSRDRLSHRARGHDHEHSLCTETTALISALQLHFLPFLIPKESSFPQHCSPSPILLGLLGVGAGSFCLPAPWPSPCPETSSPPPSGAPRRSLLCLKTTGPQGNHRLFVRRVRRIQRTLLDHTRKSQAWKTRGVLLRGAAELRGRRSGSWVVSDEEREGKTQRWARRPRSPRRSGSDLQAQAEPGCPKAPAAQMVWKSRADHSRLSCCRKCPHGVERLCPCCSSLEIGALVGTACALPSLEEGPGQ